MNSAQVAISRAQDLIDPVAAADDPKAIAAQEAKESLKLFVYEAWELVEPETELMWNWHLDVICAELEAITRGERPGARLIVNVPPGTMKSMLISVFWPAWEWSQDPSLRYLTVSYSGTNTIRDNRRLRDIVTSEWFRDNYGVALASDQTAKVRFDTTAKGWRIATSVGGMATGEHPDRIIIDDPSKAEDGRSQTALQNCRDWYDRTISTRIRRNPAIILVMQRLHEEDLAGHLLERGGWDHICFPMRYETERASNDNWKPDHRDPRTEPGELLWPEAFDEAAVRGEEIALGPYGTAGQLQQNPVVEGGGLFKREWFEIVAEAPVKARRTRGWDTAATEDGGDWTVGVKLAEIGGIWYVEHVVRDQVSPAGVESLMKQTAELDGRRCDQREEREGGSSGKAVTMARAKMLVGYDYAERIVSKDKVTRSMPFRAQCEAGNVRLVKGQWNAAYLDVLCAFPVGKWDDDVDGSSCAFNSMVDTPRVRRVKLSVGRG